MKSPLGGGAGSIAHGNLGELLLPAAMPGLVVGCCWVWGAIAETAALIFTSGYVDRMPESLWIRGALSSTFTTSP